MQKNVDYAAYEYNVYLRCDFINGEKEEKKNTTGQQ